MDTLGKEEQPRGWLRGNVPAIRTRRYLWVAAASVSVSSSRYLLVELNVNFPLYLSLFQFAALAASVAISYSITSDVASLPLRNVTVAGWTKLALALVSTAAGILLGLQSLLHFQNVPTLMMLTATCYCMEAIFLSVLRNDSRSRLELCRIAIATLSCAGILVGEYRLLPQNIETAIPAVLLTGAARVFWSMTCRSSRDTILTTRQANALLSLVGSLLAIACIIHRGDETIARLGSALEYTYLPLLAINLLATAAALQIGKSFLVPIDLAENDDGHGNNTSNVLSLLAMTGIGGLLSVSKLRRSYTSWPQYAFFALVVVLLSSRDLAARYRPRWVTMYDAVPSDVNLQSVDSEGTLLSQPSENSDATYVAPAFEDRKTVLLRIVLIAVALPAAWLAYFTLNFSQHMRHETVELQPILDLTYTPHTNTEIVISMFKEPTDQVAHLVSALKAMDNVGRDARVHIYIKDMNANVEEVQRATGANEVTPLPNIGREGETYLKHILGNWDTLARETIFLQADVHNPREFYPRVRDYFVPGRTGMLSLGWSGQVCNCDTCGDRFNFWDTAHIFPEISNLINSAAKCDKVLLSYKGQFIASAKRIRGVSKAIYQDLHDAFVNQDNWAHQEEYLQGRPDSMNAPVFGFTMERMWNLLFQCNSMEIAWRCPTLLSGHRIGGNIEDCQCLDPKSNS
ncbi:hypothetical protein PSPO01_13259 [Paraphaeosphaeria sporulosa]